MASKQGVASLGPYILRVQSGRLLAANDVASEVINLTDTPEGTLRSVIGPVAVVDNKLKKNPEFEDKSNEEVPFLAKDPDEDISRPESTKTKADQSVGPVIVYPQPMHGIYHCKLREGERDILLLHSGTELWEFTGWNRAWRQLISSPASSYGVGAILVDTPQPQYPTQFESTGKGVVIVPQGGRAYYYDGRIIAPLGFDEVPGPPSPKGPSNRKSEGTDVEGSGTNDLGYSHDGTPWNPKRKEYHAGMGPDFGTGRVGTTSELTFDASVFSEDGAGDFTGGRAYRAGWLQRGEFRCKTQYVDVFGNLSASSPPSDPVTLSFQASIIPPPSQVNTKIKVMNVDMMRKQIAWTNISTGPAHCIGRNLYRTKDLINSGDSKFYRHTQNTQGLLSDFATLPDNVTEVYPDNIPDAFLVREEQELVAVPTFKLCRLVFGRLWIGGIKSDPGAIRPSLPGRYGTFAANEELYPDPAGGEITGLARAPQGLLAFNRTGTFLITRSDDGQGFRSTVLSSQIGCEAPSSIATLSNGSVVWLGRDGFYSYDGSAIGFISEDLRTFFKQVTSSRMKQASACFDIASQEYRCWVSTNGSIINDMCLIYDGTGWRKRTDTHAVDVCVTQDHRNYVMIAGKVSNDDDNHHGPYILDHAPSPDDSELQLLCNSRSFALETSWMQANSSLVRSTARVVNLWLRETENSEVTVFVYRDWRNTVLEKATAKKYSGADVPTFYANSTLGAKDAKFVKRRPYWTRVQVYVSSGETFKFRIEGVGDWEFIGLQLETSPRNFGGAQVPP